MFLIFEKYNTHFLHKQIRSTKFLRNTLWYRKRHLKFKKSNVFVLPSFSASLVIQGVLLGITDF